MSKVISFFSDCVEELKRVTWPSKTDVWASVKVVIVSIILMAVLLGALDLGFTELFRLLMK